MITGLIYAIFITACFQPTKPRLYVALTFTSVTLVHDIFLSSLEGFAYYGSAAIGDLLIIVIISNIRPILKMTIQLNKICMISIFFLSYRVYHNQLALQKQIDNVSLFVIRYTLYVYSFT